MVTSAIFGSVMVFFPESLAAFMLQGKTQIDLVSVFLTRCGIAIVLVNMLYIVRCACQGMGKPLIPMISGIAEMILRITTIILLVPRIGFAASAFAEIFAWIGACSMNGTAYLYHIRNLSHLSETDSRKKALESSSDLGSSNTPITTG